MEKQIEVVDIRKLIGDSKLKAIAEVKLGDCIIRGFSVIEGKEGIFVSNPKKAGRDGRWHDIIVFTDEKFQEDVHDKVLEAYDREAE